MKPRNIYYKLTDQNMRTRNGFQWELVKPYEIVKYLQDPNKNLCSSSWFHVYNHPLLAILLNPIHANIEDPRLFECECTGYCKLDKGLKIGFTKVKLVKEIELPNITLTQKIAFGILCAKKADNKPKWNEWADNWLENKDRSAAAAEAAYTAYVGVDAAADAATLATAAAVNNNDYIAATAAAYAININFNLVSLAQEAMKY